MKQQEYQDLSDQELIQKYLENKNDDIFKILYQRYNKKIFYYIKKYLYYLSHDLIEELTSEVFVRVYLNLEKLRDRDKFRSWIYLIAHNQCVNFIKSEHSKKEIHNLSEEIIDNRSNMEEKCQEKELKQFIFHEINKLDNKTRELVILKFYQNLTYEEIEEIVGITVRSLKYKLKNVLKDLNKKLIKEGL